MEEYTNFEKQFRDTIKYIQEYLNLLNKNKESIFKLEEKEGDEFQLLEKEFKQKYEKFNDIKRFSIPIIGMISSGKSSFLNFLLGINCLETDDDITTKSVVIIRHNKNLEINERYIYSVIIKERSEGFYDFEIDEKTKSQELNKIIKERNNLIKNSEEIKALKKEDFFLIVEANILLFREKNGKFGNFFEFLDLPGLDEDENDSASYKSSNFFKQHILPKLACNSLFSILIFDAEKYMRKDNPIIIKNYLNTYFPKNYSNSFFILNKIDLMDNEEKEKKIFKEEMLVNQLKVNVKDETIHIQYLSCKKSTHEIKKFESFQSYLKFLLIEGSKENKTNLLIYLKEKLVEELKIDISKIGNESPTNEQKKDILEKIKELKAEVSNFTSFLNQKQYFNYSKAFEEKKSELNNKENQNKQLKIEKYKELFEAFYQSFTNSINNFLNIPNDKSLTNKIKNIVKIIDNMSHENKDSTIKTQKYIDSLYKDLSKNTRLSIEQFQNLKPIVEELYEKGKSLETFKNLKEEFNLIDFFIKKDKKLRLPLFGGYSTGKSSILNCIIGKKILPEGNQVCTRKIVVIKNNDENKYILSKTNFVKINEDYFCFEDGEVIMNRDESNYEDIYEFLKKKNEDKSNEDMFYLLSAPIFMFKKMNISKEILNKIELIDFPGIDVDEKIILDNFRNIVELCDTFIFVNDCNLIKNGENINTIKKIVNRIESRRFTFDYNSCLFILNKADKAEKNINKTKKKKEFEDILFQGNKFLDFFKKKENPEIAVSIFCSYYFLKYLSYYEEIKDFKNYINKNIKETIKENNENDELDLIEQLEERISNMLEIDFDNLEQEEVEINDEYLEKLKICLNNYGISDNQVKNKKVKLNNIIKCYINIKKNLEKNQYYINSRANSFIVDLEKKLILAKDMTEKQYTDKIKQFIKELQTIFKLLYQKSINKKFINLIELKEKMEQKLEEIYECYKENSKILIGKIDNTFSMVLKKIDDLIDLGNDIDISAPNLKKEIEEFDKFFEEEIKILDIFIKDQFFSLQYKLDNKINTALAYFAMSEDKNSLWNLKDLRLSRLRNIVQRIIFSSPFYLSSLIIPAGVCYLAFKIYDYYFLDKSELIKELYEKRKEIQNRWDSFIFQSNKLLIKSINESNKNLMMIYETQMSKFNEKKVQHLYEQLIQIIGDKYKGNLKEGKKHGYGVYSWFDGSKFEGNYENDFREGYGKMTYKEGSKYEGNWVKNQKEGFGRLITKENNKYEGEFKNNKKKGYGIFTWKDGKKYIGEFKNDYFDGIGIILYENGNRYEGEIHQVKNGIGAIYYSNGNKFEGIWKDDKKNGKGIFYLKNGNKYEGYWKDNRKILDNYLENKEYIRKIEFLDHTKVKIEYMDGDIYEGEYNQSTKAIEGLGAYYFNHGEIYKGAFKDNVFSGKGELLSDGNKTAGIFKNGKLNGYGEIEMKNGNILKGQFKDGKKEGIFSSYDKSLNKTVRRIYKDDIFIEDIEE